MSLMTKYRPESFDDLICNDAFKESIKSTIGKVHCYCFYGERGCGKTTTAYIIARELKVNFGTAFFEINCADKTGVDDMRNIIEHISYSPMGSPVKVFLLDECHMLTQNAQNSLLKALEDPPDFVYFILCTTNINKVIITIRSRAKAGMFRFKPLKRRYLSNLLDEVISKEEIEIDPKVVRAILNNSGGIPRETLGNLEKVQYINDIDEAILIVSEGIEEASVLELLRLICTVKDKRLFGTGPEDWAKAKEILKNITADPEEVRRAVLKYLEKVIMDSKNPDHFFRIMECFEDDYFSSGRAGLLFSVFTASQIGIDSVLE